MKMLTEKQEQGLEKQRDKLNDQKVFLDDELPPDMADVVERLEYKGLVKDMKAAFKGGGMVKDAQPFIDAWVALGKEWAVLSKKIDKQLTSIEKQLEAIDKQIGPQD